MSFQRARSDEQREQRRASILQTAEQMLAEMPVARLSLNELSRRVGLAKSNVLRYFDSREAVLLELLDVHSRAWADAVAAGLALSTPGTHGERPGVVAGVLARTLADRPMLCDLLAAESGVLERNVSPGAVLRHKHATLQVAATLTEAIRAVLPALDDDQALEVVVAVLLVGAAAWPYAQPGESLQAAYDVDPEVAGMHRDFEPLVARNLELLVKGLLVENWAAPR